MRLLKLPCYTDARMGKSEATKKAAPAQGDIEQYFDVIDAKQLFITEVFGLSWRLAIAVLLPLIGGIQLDKRYDSEPILTLIGLVIAFILGSITVWTAVKKVNELQAIQPNRKTKEK